MTSLLFARIALVYLIVDKHYRNGVQIINEILKKVYITLDKEGPFSPYASSVLLQAQDSNLGPLKRGHYRANLLGRVYRQALSMQDQNFPLCLQSLSVLK